MKNISVIIPCFRASDTLDRCWNSLRRQTMDPDALECIFVDDASPDRGATWKKLEEIQQEGGEDAVKIIRLSENRGAGGARNAALPYATGKYIKYLDADDELLPEACEILYERAESDGADVVQYNHLIRAGGETRTERSCTETGIFRFLTPDDRRPFLIASGKVTFGCCNKLFRTDIVRKSGARFVEHVIYEEPLFVYPQFFLADTVTLLDEPIFINHIHEDSTTALAWQHGGRTGEHRDAQMQLLQFLRGRKEWMTQYHNEIEYYFLWSYFFETILFAGQEGAVLTPEAFEEMREICNAYFPDWKNNPYIRGMDPDLAEIIYMLEQ